MDKITEVDLDDQLRERIVDHYAQSLYEAGRPGADAPSWSALRESAATDPSDALMVWDLRERSAVALSGLIDAMLDSNAETVLEAAAIAYDTGVSDSRGWRNVWCLRWLFEPIANPYRKD